MSAPTGECSGEPWSLPCPGLALPLWKGQTRHARFRTRGAEGEHSTGSSCHPCPPLCQAQHPVDPSLSPHTLWSIVSNSGSTHRLPCTPGSWLCPAAPSDTVEQGKPETGVPAPCRQEWYPESLPKHCNHPCAHKTLAQHSQPGNRFWRVGVGSVPVPTQGASGVQSRH